MAFSSTIFILFSLATACTIAHSLNLTVNVVEVIIGGQLFCTANLNPVPGTLSPRLSGANVTLSCNGGETNIGQALTDTNGFYQVILNTADGLVFDESACAIFVQLPVANCTLLPPTGTLRAPAFLLNIVPGVLGFVARFSAGVFELLLHA